MKRTIKWVIIAVTLIVIFAFVIFATVKIPGLDKDENTETSLVGKYYRSLDNVSCIELRADETVYVNFWEPHEEFDLWGTWSQISNTDLTIKQQDSYTGIVTVTSFTITDYGLLQHDTGVKWIKEIV